MSKRLHEVRDPVHVFIRYDSDEKKVIDSVPFQRLRHIHQLAMTYLVYPGATHRRFEHSLGVMELSSRIFDSIIRNEHLKGLPNDIRDQIPEIEDQLQKDYWRKVLRLAALCHDLGHLPFSHAAEDLLPQNVSHETMTMKIIMETMEPVWKSFGHPQPIASQIAKLAVGPKEAEKHPQLGIFTPWEALLSEIITGDAFGADRIDYLLRDSLHAGVSYGHFDHHRLIDTLRILPGPAADESQEYSSEPSLGIERGGLQVAESLLVARYLMFSQVYCHHVRRIYDLHLKEFLKETLDNGIYPDTTENFLDISDNDILSSIRKIAKHSDSSGHVLAKRIYDRTHFKLAYAATSQDIALRYDILGEVYAGLSEEFGADNVRIDDYSKQTKLKIDFPIFTYDKRIISAMGESSVLRSLPEATAFYIFVTPPLRERACAWVEKNLHDLLKGTDGKKDA